MIQGIIFDMDGVLLDTEKIYLQCWQQSAAEFGFQMTRDVALAVRSCCQKYAEPFLKSIFGDTFSYLQVRDRRRQLVAAHIAQHGITQKPGLVSLLTYCHNHNICTAVATATSKQLALERLKLAGIQQMFSEIIGGDEVHYGKPDPDIYCFAAKTMGIPPECCIAVEDSPNGIFSAFAAGCKPVMVPDLTPPEMAIRPILLGVAETLSDVIPYIESMR